MNAPADALHRKEEATVKAGATGTGLQTEAADTANAISVKGRTEEDSESLPREGLMERATAEDRSATATAEGHSERTMKEEAFLQEGLQEKGLSVTQGKELRR